MDPIKGAYESRTFQRVSVTFKGRVSHSPQVGKGYFIGG